MKLAVICGPTASGKTALSVELARRVGGEIVSADSMQIYKEMQIGTAKPSVEEMRGITHHMIGVVSVTEEYNVSRFVKEASACIDDIFGRAKQPLLVGGTGLYIDSLVNNTSFTEMDNDFEYREELKRFADRNGAQALHDMLEKADPDSAARLHVNDVKRVIRALEVCRISGKTMTQVRAESIGKRKYDTVFICLDFKDRSKLYERIDERVRNMIGSGLPDEAKSLLRFQLSSTARAAIGYSEIFDYLDGKTTLEQAEKDICQRTRHYAKRQLTWFRKNPEMNFFYPDAESFEAIVEKSVKLIVGKEIK